MDFDLDDGTVIEGDDRYKSPFDAAAEAAAPEDAVEPNEQLAFGEVPKKRSHSKRARKSTGGKRGRPRKDAPSAPRTVTADVKGPPAPAAQNNAAESTPVVPPIPSAQLVPLVKRLDSRIAQRFRTERLADEELSEGAAALAQLMHHYMPVALDKPWGPFAAWVILAYGPRMIDRDEPAPRLSAVPAQENVAQSAATFRAVADAPVTPATPPDISPDATAPVFQNPWDNMPDARPAGFGA